MLLLNIVNYSNINLSTIVSLLLMFILLAASALISGSEVAFFSLTPNEIDELKQRENKQSKSVIKQLKQPEKLLATILIANNFINVGIVILSTFIINSVFNFVGYPVVGFLFQVITITLFLLLFGEIVPKIYATQNSVKFSLLMSLPIFIFQKIFNPLSSILIASTAVIQKKIEKNKQNISMEDLSQALELTSNELKDEKEMLEGIIKFGNIDVKEIMKPRVNVVSIDIKLKFSKLISLIIESGFSRIVVYSKTFDNIKGILYIKDLLPYLQSDTGYNWQKLIRTPYYVPETKKIDDLLEEFQLRKIHLAIVIDEYGGASGIVTLEDILEEIVGEITDEFDTEEVTYKKISNNVFTFEAGTLLNDFYKITGCNDDVFDDIKGDADTLAGLILEISNEIPQKHETFDIGKFKFHILSADDRRIKKIKVTINNKK